MPTEGGAPMGGAAAVPPTGVSRLLPPAAGLDGALGVAETGGGMVPTGVYSKGSGGSGERAAAAEAAGGAGVDFSAGAGVGFGAGIGAAAGAAAAGAGGGALAWAGWPWKSASPCIAFI